MEKIEIKTIKEFDESTVDVVIIDHGNGEYTSMLKSTYDAQQAAVPLTINLGE